MLTTSIPDLIHSKGSNDINKLAYISTYSMGKIGFKKIVEEPLKPPITNDIKVMNQSPPINNVTNNTNNNTNNTNTNTNSNTNNNSSKNKENQTSKKKLKNIHSVSPNFFHNRIQSSNSKYYFKNKSNQRINIIKKNNSKPTLTQLKLAKKEFSNSSNNFYINTNNNIYNKNKYIYINKKSYSKKKYKSNSHSNKKLLKERKITDGKLKSHSYHSSCIFSSMSPSSIKREKKKYSASNIIQSEGNINNNNFLKRDISEIYIKNNNNLSSTDINPDSRKLVLHVENNKDITQINNIEQKYQRTESNITYLRVRRRPDFQIQFNNNIINNINKNLNNINDINDNNINNIDDIKNNFNTNKHNDNNNDNNIKNNETPKTESTPLLSNEETKIMISSPPSSCLCEDKNENNNNKIDNIEGNNNLNCKRKNNIFLDDKIPHKESININLIHNNNYIPKLNLDEEKNLKNLYHEKNNKKDLVKHSYDNGNFNINISNNAKKESENIKLKERENNFYKNYNNKNNSSNKNLYNSNKHYSNYKNKKQNKIKNIELNKSNTNDNAFIKYNYSNKKFNNISSLKDVKTEENLKNYNVKKNTRNNKKFSTSRSKNKYKNRTKKNYSLSNSKNKFIAKSDKNRVLQLKSNYKKSSGNQTCKNRIVDLNKKMKEKVEKQGENKQEIDCESPEELHYFMVNLAINYKFLTENF